MKRIVLLLIMSCIGFNTLAQEKEAVKYPQDINKNHEIKLNAFSLIVFSTIDVSYEKLLNKDSSYGISLFYNFATPDSDLYFPKKFSLTPYYRWFFTETRYARGFFVEGFGMLNTYEETLYYFDSTNDETISETGFALGISVGGKFIIKSGFTAEVYLGIGRNLFNSDNDFLENNIVTRGGISLGYRF
ncbi:DUF3575 domain-containing protein [uncultured Polaribacter sp.]|uniref:DUF3575 domain-containing protein n=1 Tax=uncultured Polaribacter sp. TaxID=174711 RepID=UPI00261B3E05|nr:DUF3575 domain-containing protein [uncultured Polaribacter sp.]